MAATSLGNPLATPYGSWAEGAGLNNCPASPVPLPASYLLPSGTRLPGGASPTLFPLAAMPHHWCICPLLPPQEHLPRNDFGHLLCGGHSAHTSWSSVSPRNNSASAPSTNTVSAPVSIRRSSQLWGLSPGCCLYFVKMFLMSSGVKSVNSSA